MLKLFAIFEEIYEASDKFGLLMLDESGELGKD